MNTFRLGLTTLIVVASLSFAMPRGKAAEPAIAQNWASQFAAIVELIRAVLIREGHWQHGKPSVRH
jgi:hypothetical protein